MNAHTGAVSYWQGRKVGTEQLISFYHDVRASYLEAETIYLVQDNAPMHFHPNVLCQLQEQRWPWSFIIPPSWQALPMPDRIADSVALFADVCLVAQSD